jgi:hypothetical protein
MNFRTSQDARPSLEKIDAFLAGAGRPRSAFGIDARMHYGDADPARWVATVRDWEGAGATHVSLNTMAAKLEGPAAHLDGLRRFAAAIGLTPP